MADAMDKSDLSLLLAALALFAAPSIGHDGALVLAAYAIGRFTR
jgi:hypothetical protein